MIDLDLIRHHINQMDQELLHLLEQRLDISKNVAEAKKENQIPVKDTKREEAIVNDLQGSSQNLSPEFIETIWNAIFVESRRRQEEHLVKK